jgi:IS30 family transposase
VLTLYEEARVAVNMNFPSLDFLVTETRGRFIETHKTPDFYFVMHLSCSYYPEEAVLWHHGWNKQISDFIQRHLPKDADFSKIDKKQIITSSRSLMPDKKYLGFKTP